MVDRLGLHGRRAGGQTLRRGQGRFSRCRDLRERSDLLPRQAPRCAASGGRSRARDRRPPAAAGFRGDARSYPGANFERAASKLDLMHELGARLLCLCSNVSPEAIDDACPRRGGPRRACRSRPPDGMRIGYEALAWGRWVKDWITAWDIVRAADRDNLGIVLDSFHICARGNPIEPIAALPAEKIALVQVADAPALVMDPLSLEPALPLLSRPGRLPDRRLSRRRDPLRLSRPAVARNLQRPVSRRLCRGDRGRRHALAARRRRGAGGKARRARRAAAR